MSIRIHLLGSRELAGVSGHTPTFLAQPKRLALIAYLAARQPGEWVSRDRLLGLLWPETDEARGRKALSQALWFVRSELGENAIDKRGAGEVRLAPGVIDFDLWRFENQIAAGRPAEALKAYGGEFLAGFHVSGLLSLERWIEETRERLRRSALAAAWELADKAESAGDISEIRRWTFRAREIARPDDEAALARLMERLAAIGDSGAGLAAYAAYADELEAEGDSPGVALRNLAHRLSTSPRPVAPSVPTDHTRQPATPSSEAPEVALVSTVERLAPTIRWRSLWTIAILLVCLVTSVLVAERARQIQEPPEALVADTESRVVVMPFSIRGASEWDYLGAAMVDLMSSRLDGAGDLRAIDAGAVFEELRSASSDMDSAERIAGLASRFGADLIVSGNVVEVGGTLELSATLRSPRGELLASAITRVVDDAHLLEGVDALTLDLLGDRFGQLDAELLRGAALETRSVPALKAYLRGEDAFWRMDFRSASVLYQEAVRHDSAFALAHYRLSRSADWLDDGSQLIAAREAAGRHRYRLPARYAELLEAYTVFWEESISRGIARLESLTKRYPYDGEAWFQYGDALFHGGPRIGRPVENSEAAFQRALELNPADKRVALHLLALAARRGDAERAAELAALIPTEDPVWAFQVTALVAGAAGTPLRGSALERALDDLPVSRLASAVISPADFLEDPEILLAAGHRLASGIGSQPQEGLRLRFVGELAAGRFAAAHRVSNELLIRYPEEGRRAAVIMALLPWVPRPFVPEAAHQIGPLMGERDPYLVFLEGFRAFSEGEFSRGEEARRRLAELALDNARQHLGVVLDVARLEAEGDHLQALRNLEDLRREVDPLAGITLDPLLSSALEALLRARLLTALDREEEALVWYQSIPTPVSYTLHFAAPFHLERAQILDRLGRHREALVARQRAARLWAQLDELSDEDGASLPFAR